MDTRKQYTDYFGFDLGDGESAVTWMRAGRRTEPQLVELRGRKSIITALGKHPERGTLIGEEACQMNGLEWVCVRFKRKYLTDPEGTGALIEQFARTVLEILRADGRIDDIDKACFFIGCPSGWSEAVRASYKEHFVRAGMIHCEIISESRAAFMFARESGELKVSDDLLTRPTLIIDAGSSTTDFTYVADLHERSLRACDFGEVALGGGLIDRLVLEDNVRRSGYADEIHAIMEKYSSYAARCEFEARRVKEMYFTQQMRGSGLASESALKIYAGIKPITLDISVNDADMHRIVNKPLEELGGRSFCGAYREALARARRELSDALPETVLLTGGASRMPLIETICAEIFPEAQILRGLEPEYAIARGLCHALRIDQKTKGFSEAVGELIRSDDMEKLVMNRLGELYEAVSGTMTDKLADKLAPEAFAMWRGGALDTINDISDEIGRRAAIEFESVQMKELLSPAIGKWLESIRPDIERLTDPICDKYDLPRTSLRLPTALSVTPTGVKIAAGDLIRMNELKAVVDVIAGTVMAAILGGGGMALLASGLVGWLVGLVVGLAAGVIGTELAEQKLRSANLPQRVRMLFSQKWFKKSLSKRRDALRENVCNQLKKELNPPTKAVQNTVQTIAKSIENQLEQMMKRATLLIH